MEIEREIKWMKSMMDSLFTYGGLTKDNRYLKKYKDMFEDDVFNDVFDTHSIYLNTHFRVEENVGKDSDGVTYNSLVKKF